MGKFASFLVFLRFPRDLAKLYTMLGPLKSHMAFHRGTQNAPLMVFLSHFSGQVGGLCWAASGPFGEPYGFHRGLVGGKSTSTETLLC